VARSTPSFDGAINTYLQSDEEQLIVQLRSLADCLLPHDAVYPDLLTKTADEAQALFERHADIGEKFDFVNSHNFSTAGMGSLNDGVVPETCTSHQHNLYRSINDLLRLYWKQLGRESYNYSDFVLIADGTEVRLIPGKTIFRNGVYSTDVKPSEAEQIWTVFRCDGPDITGMPHYAIYVGNRIRSARHESLAIVGSRRC